MSLMATRLRAVDLLDLVDQVALEIADTEDREDVVRIDRTVDAIFDRD